MSRNRGGRFFAAVAALTVFVVAGYVAYVYIRPMLHGTGCRAETSAGSIRLTTEQTENAATIAAVAMRMDLPRRATTIGLATAFQETKLRNLPYGDRDSVGLFQQRPSQGWGRKQRLLDPVYATRQFFETLVDVPHYAEMPIHEAAQAVQRSADGDAYVQHEAKAKILSAALTGRAGAGLHCWFSDGVGDFDLRELRTQVRREFGRSVQTTSSGSDLEVSVSGRRQGWAFALWAVGNAAELGISSVVYDGKSWVAEDGYRGWQPADTPSDRVRIRGSA